MESKSPHVTHSGRQIQVSNCAPGVFSKWGYDEITREIKNMKRVIDDTLLYAANLEKAFTQVAECLTLVGKNGIILNPE